MKLKDSFLGTLTDTLGKVVRYEQTKVAEAAQQRMADVEILQREFDNTRGEFASDPERRPTFAQTRNLFSSRIKLERQVYAPLQLQRTLVVFDRYRVGLGSKACVWHEGPLPYEAMLDAMLRKPKSQ